MRQIGSFPDEQPAQVFADYLVTQGITAHSERDEEKWAIWVRDENDVPQAKSELESYQRDPDGSKYRDVSRIAHQIRDQEQQRRQEAARNTIEMRNRWSQPAAKRAPLTMTLIGLCVLIALATSFGFPPQDDPRSTSYRIMLTLMYSLNSQDLFQQIRQGQVWRLVTPIFMHKGILHLLFNMYWLYTFGTQIESKRGTARYGLFILLIALASNTIQAIAVGPGFLGISGVVYGLLGYIWMKKAFDPRSGFFLSDSILMFMLLFLVLGFTGILNNLTGPMANWAHAGGLLAGMALGYVPTYFDSMKARA